MKVRARKVDLSPQVVTGRRFFFRDISRVGLRILIFAGILLPIATVLGSLAVFGVDLSERQWLVLSVLPLMISLLSVGLLWFLSEAIPDCSTCNLQEMNAALDRARLLSEKSAQHMRDVLNSVPVFIGVLNSDGAVLEANDAVLTVLGENLPDVAGKKFEDATSWSFLEPSKRHIREIIDRVKAGDRYGGELKYQTRSGELRTVDFQMNPIFNDDGTVEFLIASGIDIEARKSVERQLINSRKDAEAASQAKSAFLAHLSHELRSPLGVILGFVDIAMDEADSNEKNNHLETIRRNAQQLVALVDEMLDLGRIEAGRVSLDIGDVRLDKLISELQVSLNVMAREHGLELNFVWEPGTPIEVRTDPLRLKQILVNLIGNALKYSEHGKVECVIRRHPVNISAQPKIEFEISDSGIGISEVDAAKIFEPFFRGREVERKKIPGTGLGLPLAKRLAVLLGGDVVLIRSQTGIGSTFSAAIAERCSDDESSISASLIPAGKIDGGCRLAGMSILIVDDVSDNRVLIARYLEAEGASVVTASGGEEAIALATQHGFDAILMDLSMPAMSGQEATATLREIGCETPIVALTAHAMGEEKKEALLHGFNDYLVKPVLRDVLVECLGRFLPCG